MISGEISFDALHQGTRPAVSEFPDALNWVNWRAPVRLADLRGHIVLLVFWQGASTSSANLLGEIRALEKKHPDTFSLVCVHTPRYAAQSSDAAVSEAAQRYRVQAPVANDHEWLAWRQFSVAAWPTTLVIDAEGRLAACMLGEGRAQEIEDAVMHLREEMPLAAAVRAQSRVPDAQAVPAGPLAFPAHALATDSRLFVCDSGHHRVLECMHDGRVLRQFGSGTPGNWDGQLAACAFQFPQGLAAGRDVLYVADTGNHCIRRIRLDGGDVETVLGTGQPAYANVEEQGGSLRVRINAPQALALDGEVLYVAAMGQNQILRVDLRQQCVETLAGDGRSDVRDGIGGQSSFSQPAALAILPGQLLVADAGGNAIRRLRFADLVVTTLAGSSPWEPGNHDGVGHNARFAYPSGIAAGGNRVFVADTWNDRLCMLDPYSGQAATLQFDYPLHEPQGLSWGGGSLWVADRNDHVVLRIDPDHGTCERVPVDE
jgi:NHL repeat